METATGMTAFITALTTAVTTDTLWAEVTKAVPFIGAMLIFAFGYMIVKKSIKKAPKGKVGI